MVLATEGYPEIRAKATRSAQSRRPRKISTYFTRAPRSSDGKVLTDGGRVLCVTALGDTVRVAQRRAYEIAEQIQFRGRQMRRDIGYRAIGAKRSLL